MLSFIQRTVLITLIGLIFFITCGEKGNQPVARVGGRIINVSEFENDFSRGKSQKKLAKATLADKLNHLNKMIDKELKIVAAYRKKLDQDEQLIKKVETRRQTTNLILKHLYEKVVVKPIISESEIKKYYDKSKQKVQIAEIFIEIQPNATDQEQQEVDNKLKAIMSELKNDAEFSDLIKQYSQHKSKSASGKDQTKQLSFNPMTSQDPVTQQAFTMKIGEYSDPIKTSTGYSIIKVTDIIDVEPKPYDVEKRRIKVALMRVRSKQLNEKSVKYLENLKDKYNAKYDEDNIEKFIQIFNESNTDTSQNAKPQSPMARRNPFSKFSDQQKELSVASYDGGTITIGNLIEKIGRRPVKINENKGVKNLIDRAALFFELLKLDAKAKNIRNNKEVKKELKLALERFMINEISKMEVIDKIEVTDDDLKEYFEKHREDYKHPETREVQEIFVKDSVSAKQIASRARTGENFTTLAEKYNEKAATKKKNGNLGFIKKTRKYIGEPAFELDIGGIAGPIKIGNNYSIIKLLSINEAKYDTFNEVKQKIPSKVNKTFRENREKEWIDELRKEIEITIYENRVKRTFSNLKQDI